MKRLFDAGIGLVVGLLLMGTPVLAQGDVLPTGDDVIVNILVVAFFVLLIGMVGGIIWLLDRANARMENSVAKDVVHEIILTPAKQSIGAFVEQQWDKIQRRSTQTTNPLDDAVVNTATVPVQKVIDWLQAQQPADGDEVEVTAEQLFGAFYLSDDKAAGTRQVDPVFDADTSLEQPPTRSE